MHRRLFLSIMAAGLAVAMLPGMAAAQNRLPYRGAETVYFENYEQPGTIIIDTSKRALFYILSDSEAIRYGIAVGKEGFSWAGIAEVGPKM